jgi:hypothetical protein
MVVRPPLLGPVVPPRLIVITVLGPSSIRPRQLAGITINNTTRSTCAPIDHAIIELKRSDS